jgi:hypothetical protein
MVTIVDTSTAIIIQLDGTDGDGGRELLGLLGESAAVRLVTDLLQTQLKQTYRKRADRAMGDYLTLSPSDQGKIDAEIAKLKGA